MKSTLVAAATWRRLALILFLSFLPWTDTAIPAAPADEQLIRAAAYGVVDEAKDLLDKGADPNAQDQHGWTPLMWAARKGDMAVVQLLVQRGADVDVTNEYGWTSLKIAARGRNSETVRLLIERGADIRASDTGGCTALMAH